MPRTPSSPDITLSEGAHRIVQIAAPLFAARGFNGVSINDVAAAAGGSKANIFHHFPSKEALYLAVIRTACSGIRDELRKLAGEAESEGKRLAFIARQHLEQMSANPDSIRLILREVLTGDSGIKRSLVAGILHDNFAFIVDEIRQEQDRAQFREDANAALVAVAIIAVNTFFFQSWPILEQFEEFADLESAQQCADQVFDTIAKGLLIQ